MTWHVHIAHKYDADLHEAEGISVDDFLRKIDRLREINGEIVEWYDEENEMAWELSRTAIANTLSNTVLEEDIRVFLQNLLAQSNPELDFMRIEFY